MEESVGSSRVSGTCGPGDGFQTTRWSRVMVACSASPATESSEQALGELCAAYYRPVVAFLRGSGLSADDAVEAAHEFFEALLARDGGLAGVDPLRGRFRSYLIGALKHHLARRRERDGRMKRGAGAEHVPLGYGPPAPDGQDTSSPSGTLREVADPASPAPDEAFDRQWALTILARALDGLEAEAVRHGAGERFARLRPWLTGDADHGDQRAVADALGMTPSALKVAVHRLRRAFRERVRAEVARTLADEALVEEEMQVLRSALGGA